MELISTPVKKMAYSDDPFLMDEAEEEEKTIKEPSEGEEDEEGDGPDNY